MKVITFDGKQIIEPGAYARTVGGNEDAPELATFGNALIIDTGSMAGYGYGSGINGSHQSGANSIYSFSSIDDFKKAVAGSVVWDAAAWLFKPSRDLGIRGVQNVILVHARTTTKGTITLTFVGGGTKASGNVVFAALPLDAATITIGGVAYTFKDTPTLATHVKIATSVKETMVNLAEKLAQSTDATLKLLEFKAGTDRINITYRIPGTAGNAVTLAASVATPSGATLAGGVAGSGANGGVVVIEPIVEGLGANGLVDPTSSDLYKGFAVKVVAGITDSAKFALEFWRGTYKGLDFDSVPFDNISRDLVEPELITKSDEFSTLQELFDWMDTNAEFASWYKRNKTSCSINGTGALIAADTTTHSGYNLFNQGTEVYNASDLTKVYEYIKETDYSFILADKYEDDGDDTVNLQHISHINLQSEFKRILVVGGGADSTKFTQAGGSIPMAATFNDENVHILHSRTYKNGRELPTIYHAAAFLGRAAGSSPQVNMTWKDLDFDGVKHVMSQKERELCIQKGVTHMKNVSDLGWVINLDNNTKQKNQQEVYADGTSPYGSIVRIKNLLNKEISLNLRKKFTGGNANTADPASVKSETETILLNRTANKTDDNLILNFKNVKTNLVGADYKITYGFTSNGPVNRLFITGTMFNVSASA